MTSLTLTRLASMPFGVFGQLAGLATVEDPWLDNQPNVSCIPAGTYTAKRYKSPHFGVDVFMLQGVPGRSAIEIHTANLPRDVRGCIGVAEDFGCLYGSWGIVNKSGSEAGFKRLMALLEGKDEISLRVEWWRP